MKSNVRHLLIPLVAAAALGPSACGGGESEPPPASAPLGLQTCSGMQGYLPPQGTLAESAASALGSLCAAPTAGPEAATLDCNPNTTWNASATSGALTLTFPSAESVGGVQIRANAWSGNPNTGSTQTFTIWGAQNGDYRIIGQATLQVANGTNVLTPITVENGRYTQLQIQVQSSPSFVAIADVTLLPATACAPLPGAFALPQGTVVTASGNANGYPPSNAADCNASTIWVAGNYTGTLTLQFPSSKSEIAAVALSATASPNANVTYTIRGRDAGVYRVIGSATYAVTGPLTPLAPIPVEPGRYDAIAIDANAGQSWVGIGDVGLVTPDPAVMTARSKLAVAQLYWQYAFWNPSIQNYCYAADTTACNDQPLPTVPSGRDPADPKIDCRYFASTDITPADQQALVDHFTYLFDLGARARIDAFAVLVYGFPGDLIVQRGQTASIRAMLTAQSNLRSQGKSPPRILFHADGIEYWDNGASCNNEDWTQAGSASMSTLWGGVSNVFDVVVNAAGSLDDRLLRTFNATSFPLFIYHAENYSQACSPAPSLLADNTMANELRSRFATRYAGQSLTVVPETLWWGPIGGYPYNFTVYNGDTYYEWGAASSGPRTVGAAVGLPLLPVYTTTLGPGFQDRWHCSDPPNNGSARPRDRARWQSELIGASTNGTNWLNLETFNFWSETTELAPSVQHGCDYLNDAGDAIARWKRSTQRRLHPVAITASGQSAGSPAVNAEDGQESTVWNSGGFGPQWIRYDLGGRFTPQRVRLLNTQTGSSGLVQSIEASNDGQNWTPIGQVTTGVNQWTEATLNPPSGAVYRYLRVYTASSPGTWVAFREVAFFGW